MGRWWKRVRRSVGVVVFALGGLVAVPAHACACGTLLLPDGERAVVRGETAILTWDGQTQRIVLSLDVESEATEAALLIPTPGPGTVEILDEDLTSELAHLSAPRVEQVDLWWPEWLSREDLDNDGVSPDLPAVPEPIRLEGVEVETLEAADAAGLEGWLQKHDYLMRDDVAEALTPYIQQEWHFVLIRLAPESLDGRLRSIDISFESKQLVYPMRLGVAGGPVEVRTYVFAEHRMERADAMRGTLTWAGEVRQTDFTRGPLVEIAKEYPFLTVWEERFSDPRNQIDGDMVFAAASQDLPFQQVYTEVNRKDLFGMPAGPTLIFGGLIIIGFGGGIVSRVRRQRRWRRGAAAVEP